MFGLTTFVLASAAGQTSEVPAQVGRELEIRVAVVVAERWQVEPAQVVLQWHKWPVLKILQLFHHFLIACGGILGDIGGLSFCPASASIATEVRGSSSDEITMGSSSGGFAAILLSYLTFVELILFYIIYSTFWQSNFNLTRSYFSYY